MRYDEVQIMIPVICSEVNVNIFRYVIMQVSRPACSLIRLYQQSILPASTSSLHSCQYSSISGVSRSVVPRVSPTTFIDNRGFKYDFKEIRKDKNEELDKKEKESKEEESGFDKAAAELALDLTNVFLNKVTIPLYHPEVVLEDRIRGQTFNGLLLYIKNMHLLKIAAHIKFVYVRPQIVSMKKFSDERKIVVDWKFVGLTLSRMVVRYFPDKLWNRANMDQAASTWYEGVSTFYLSEDNQIIKHVVEKNVSDNEETLQQMRDKVSQLKKLK